MIYHHKVFCEVLYIRACTCNTSMLSAVGFGHAPSSRRFPYVCFTFSFLPQSKVFVVAAP